MKAETRPPLRKFGKILEDRLQEKAPLIQILLGPRQVGKTTAVKEILPPHAVYDTADSPVPLGVEFIDQLWDRVENGGSSEQVLAPVLAIDEIQKISGWSEVVKKRWDARRSNIKVILTGSSSLQIEKGLKESLAGRFEITRADHWNYKEAHDTFNLDLRNYIEWGCYPGAQAFRQDPQRWGAYVRDSIVEPIIGRDLLQLHSVENPALLRQILGIGISLPSQIISLQKIQGQLQDRGAIATIQHYLQLLGHAFLVTAVEKYSSQTFQSRKSSPKLIVHENSLIRAFERPVNQIVPDDRMGRYLENIVGARFIEAGWDVFYWKDRLWEVDFVVRSPHGQNLAIEVKSGQTSLDQMHGVFQFVKNFPEFLPCLVSLQNQKLAGIRTLPIEEVLSLDRFVTAL